MIVWFDAQLSPQLASWLVQRFGVTAHAVRDLGGVIRPIGRYSIVIFPICSRVWGHRPK
jgi:hypothetical protein